MKDWPDQARCKGSPIELFFTDNAELIAKAMSLCMNCPVMEECREYSMKYEEFGTFGGLTAPERKRLRKEIGIRLNQRAFIESPQKHQSCGTNAGYVNLLRYYQNHPFETKIRCEYCHIAHRKYVNSLKSKTDDQIIKEALVEFDATLKWY